MAFPQPVPPSIETDGDFAELEKASQGYRTAVSHNLSCPASGGDPLAGQQASRAALSLIGQPQDQAQQIASSSIFAVGHAHKAIHVHLRPLVGEVEVLPALYSRAGNESPIRLQIGNRGEPVDAIR